MAAFDLQRCIAWYLLFSVLVAILPLLWLRKRYPGEEVQVYLFFLSFMLLIPCIGIFLAFWLALYMRLIRHEREAFVCEHLNFDEYYAHFPLIRRQLGEGEIYQIFQEGKISEKLRLLALTMLSERKDRQSFVLIKRMLSSRNDELRLFSFSIIDKVEHELHQKIHEELERYRACEREKCHVNEARKLAFLYWELVYFELADEILRNFLLAEAERYATEAIDRYALDDRLLVLLGRISFERGHWNKAKRYFEAALSVHDERAEASRSFILPYLAEIEFLERNFTRVRQLLREATHFRKNPKLRGIQELWNR